MNLILQHIVLQLWLKHSQIHCSTLFFSPPLVIIAIYRFVVRSLSFLFSIFFPVSFIFSFSSVLRFLHPFLHSFPTCPLILDLKQVPLLILHSWASSVTSVLVLERVRRPVGVGTDAVALTDMAGLFLYVPVVQRQLSILTA